MADVNVVIKKNAIDEEIYLGVEYIESTGTQYIQIGEDVDYNTTHLYIDYQYTDVTGTSSYSQGAVYSISYYRVYADILWAAFASAGYGLYSYAYSKSSNGERITPNASTSRCVFERNTNGVFFNGEQKSVSQNYTPIGNSTTNITLFAMNFGNEQSITMKSKMRIYGFKLGNSQGYKYDLVPCIRKLDQVAGLYDVINKKFYTNAGTGTFSVGAETGLTYYDDTLIIDKFNGLKSIESLSQSTGQPKEIFYGAVPSTGSLEITDVNGQIAKMVRNGTIPNSNVKVNIFANSKQVQTHLSTNSDYNINSQSFSVDLENEIGKWDYLEFLGRNANGKASIYDILKDIFGEDVDNMLNTQMVYGESIEGSVKEYVQSITMDYPYLIKGTLQETINKICAVAQLNVFQDDDGNIKFVSARPIYTHSDKIISIPSKNIIGPPIRDIILKNQYGYVEINERKFNRTINVKHPIYNILNYEPLDSELVSLLNTTSKLSNGSTTSSNPAVRYIETSYGSETTFWGVMTYLEGIYCKFNVVIPKKSNYNLTQITAINTSNENINAQVTYRIYNASAKSNTRYPTIDDFTIGEYVDTQNEYVGSIDDKFSYESWNTVNGETLGIDMELPKSNQYVKIVSEDENNYNLEVCVLVGRKSMSDTDSGSPSSLDWTTTIRYLKPIKFDMSIYGNNYEITFDDNLVPLGSSDAIYSISIESNELLQDSTMYNGEKLSHIIGNNILNDYKNGIHTAEITCICSDYFDIDGKKVKNWAKGDILQIGDVVRIDKDNLGTSAIKYSNGKDIYFKVVGRTFRKDGIPLLDLELQEVKQLPQDGGLYSDSNFTIKIASWDELIDNGTIIVSEDSAILQKANTNIDGYLKISSLVKEIKHSAFYNCKNLKGVDFNNVEIIGDGAFESCIGLENVEIKDNVTKIGNSAFSECTNLKSVSLGNGITKIDGLFYGCSSLSSISLPSSITTIEGYSFAECTSLSSISLNDGLKIIADGVFQNCPITTITIPLTVKKIGYEAFMGCSKLQNAIFEKLTGWRASDYSSYYDIDVSNSTINATYLTQTYLAGWINDEL